MRTFVTSVVATERITPRLRRVTVGGPGLDGFEPAGPDQFVYVLLPPPRRTELTIGTDFSWDAYEQMPAADRPVGAYYTVRRWRPEVRELDLDVVLHGLPDDAGDAHDGGHGARWGATTVPGDPVALCGPRTCWDPPADTDQFLLVADETGLPALAAILDALPDGTRARAFIEVDGEGDRLPLREADGICVTWLHRGGLAPGSTTLLLDAVRAWPVPGGVVYAWGGAESRCATAVRRHLRDEVGLEQHLVSMTGYWRRARRPDDADED